VNDVAPGIFSDAYTMLSSDAEQIDAVPANATGLFCEEPGCGTELTYGGRGRKPKRCPEHKRGATPSDRPPKSSTPKGIERIKADIRQVMFVTGVAVTPYDQYDGAVLIGSANKVADSFALLALKFPEFRKWLEKGGDGMMWVQIIMGLSSVAIPILAHHGVLPIDEKIAYQKFVDPKIDIS
jgi:hypothetical protein